MYRKINGKSLIEIKINHLLKTKVDEIAVGSDADIKLEKICKKYKNKRIKFYLRPDYYCDEKVASANETIINMLSYIKSDIILWCYPINPFSTNKHYSEALNLYLKNLKRGYDGLYSVTKTLNYFGNKQKPN